MEEFTSEQVSLHESPKDGWMTINGSVYDISKFYDSHPGSSSVLSPYLGGKVDATNDFFALHRSSVLKKYERLKIGKKKGEKPTYILPTPGALSPVPFAEPAWLTEVYKSPYFDDSHRRLQKEVRLFFDIYVRGESLVLPFFPLIVCNPPTV